LRRQPGISRVVLIGFSGGGPRQHSTRRRPRKAPPIARSRASSPNAAMPWRICRRPTACCCWTPTPATP
jgi:hypothetical protein